MNWSDPQSNPIVDIAAISDEMIKNRGLRMPPQVEIDNLTELKSLESLYDYADQYQCKVRQLVYLRRVMWLAYAQGGETDIIKAYYEPEYSVKDE